MHTVPNQYGKACAPPCSMLSRFSSWPRYLLISVLGTFSYYMHRFLPQKNLTYEPVWLFISANIFNPIFTSLNRVFLIDKSQYQYLNRVINQIYYIGQDCDISVLKITRGLANLASFKIFPFTILAKMNQDLSSSRSQSPIEILIHQDLKPCMLPILVSIFMTRNWCSSW